MSGQVTATALGDWPGSDPLEATRAIRGELGTPHLPVLAELPGRGLGSDPVGRTASLLADLHADVQPHGWRLVPHRGRDASRAESALSTDLNVLADVAGSEERSAEELHVRILGPLSLMAGLYVPSGERVLGDHGARRDVAQSLAAGVVPFLGRVARAVPGVRLTVQLDEPDAARVLAGGVPTASGYRTLRSVPGEEASSVWGWVAESLHAGGAEAVIVNLPADGAPSGLFGRVLDAGADGVSVPLGGLAVPQWEELAAAVESGARLWLGALPHDAGAGVRTGDLAERVVRPWRQLGLPFDALDTVRLTPEGSLAALTPGEATARLARTVKLVDAVNQIALG